MPTITGKPLPPPAKAVLEEIMASAGVASCEVTSVGRDPDDQARVMYENLIGTGVGQGLEAQMKLYKAPGQSVIQVWNVNQAKPRAEVIQMMADRIRQLGPETVSKHCSTTQWVWDVAPSSVAIDKRDEFIVAVKNHPKMTKFLQPPQDPAYHIQIARISPEAKEVAPT
jgi:hypothetical protein